MADVVVTLPKSFGLKAWIEEGDAAGDKTSDQIYYWKVPSRPRISPGDRVYVVYDGRLIGYAPLSFVSDHFVFESGWYLVRGGGAVAVTIDEEIRGFRGYRYRWWGREDEKPFPDWKDLA